MKANELRIGNIIREGEIISFYESGVHVGNGKCYPFSEIEPIEITHEIIQKIGFEKNYHYYTIDNDLISLSFGDVGFYSTYVCGDAKINNIQFVHQLQNLYFALSGKELEFKEPITLHTGIA